MSSQVLEVERASVAFAGVHALEDVSLSVEQRHILGLIGPNGAGKTTLVNVITGFLRPGRGRILLEGTDITRHGPERRSRHGLARTFQGVRLFGSMSVSENIEVAALASGCRRSTARSRAADAIELLALTGRAGRPAADLPYGDQRRLAIARCLATEPKLLLLDEPAAGMNEEETVELGDALAAIRDEHGLAMVLVEHDVPLVMRLSNRVHVLAEGRTLAVGTPKEIRANEHVVAAYLGVDDAQG
jgi:branched-chain amino acid transport system ATP-binding protein